MRTQSGRDPLPTDGTPPGSAARDRVVGAVVRVGPPGRGPSVGPVVGVRPGRRYRDRMVPNHRRPALRAVAATACAVAVALAAVACGGSSDSSAARTMSLSSWTQKVNALCAEARKDVDAVPSPADTTDYPVLQESGIAVKRRINQFIDDVDKLGAPDEQAKQAAAFMDQWRTYTGDFDALVAAAKAEDPAKVESAGTALQAASKKKDAQAKALGLKDCWKDDNATAGSTGDTTGDTLSKNPTSTTEPDTSAGSASGGTLAPAQWSAEVNAACTTLTQKYQSIGQANPQTPEEAQQVANDLNSFATELVAEWDRIGPPDGETTQAQQLYDLFVQFKQTATDFQNAVAAQDSAKLDSITTQIDGLTGQITPLANSLDIPACGS